MTDEIKVTETVVDEQTPETEVETKIEEVKVEEPEVTKSSQDVETVTPKDVPIVDGNIDNCAKLNIRVKPHPASRVVSVLNKGTRLIIDEEGSTADWYKVRTPEGAIYGYCMKQYVTKNR